jgi:hypothetical protein
MAKKMTWILIETIRLTYGHQNIQQRGQMIKWHMFYGIRKVFSMGKTLLLNVLKLKFICKSYELTKL